MRTSKFVVGTSRAITAIVSMASKGNPAGKKSERQEIDDLPEKSHLDKLEVNNDKQELDKGRYIKA